MDNDSKIKEKNPFRVPENYFEEVKKDIMTGVADTAPEERKSSIVRLLRPVVTLAAAMLLLVIISYSGLKLLFPGNDRVDELNYSELVYQFDEAELISKLVDEKNDFHELSIDSDEIIEYLLEEDIEYASIIEFLNQEI